MAIALVMIGIYIKYENITIAEHLFGKFQAMKDAKIMF